ncbi:hypothetical protein WG68_14930 [Arsukibacterium ikkense]|uniref:Lipoprotein n=1 Tax=Arsukibacterium ikkense TaxID=336831 RepID=A0A0M2V167_9GAMM|nr:hypothetical protein [Arsukibacterium ikkense]KKO44587.1 hypothetical protein WG68_14930 [Arsukibacterium ikkense]
MKSRRQLYLLVPAITLFTACSTAPHYAMQPDYDYIQKVEASSKYSTHAARIYWVNPPVKRELLAEQPQD